MRVILHADMDAFYAAIEQRDRPELAGKPVIVGGAERRMVVSTASYEARKFGVHSAMPGVIAKRLCPHGIFVTPRMDRYAEVSAEVMRIFQSFTPLVEPLSLDEAFLDVTGSQALFGDGVTIARALQARVANELRLSVSVGVAASKYVAKVASDLRKPAGLVVVPAGTELEFLAPLPLRCLWGAGHVTVAQLEAHGLATIGDLQALDLARLQAICGHAAGAHFFALARGADPRPVVVGRDARSISHELTFADDLVVRADAHRVILRLAEQVGRRLRADALVGAVVRIKVRDPDFTTITRQRKLPAPANEDLCLARAAQALFDTARPQMRPVRLLGVGVAELMATAALRQGDLFGAAPAKLDRVMRALDTIRDRFGEDSIGHGGAR